MSNTTYQPDHRTDLVGAGTWGQHPVVPWEDHVMALPSQSTSRGKKLPRAAPPPTFGFKHPGGSSTLSTYITIKENKTKPCPNTSP